ncbi:MAG: hypothetical protein FIB08_16175 [Candidatus Methanoperedens sp.]|nr:hypothetical protein [Candidatus Methanoperedens sp.]
MGIVAPVTNIQTPFTIEVIQYSGAIVVIFLIVFIFIKLLVSDSRYWHEWSESTLNATIRPLLIIFVAIIIHRIILII